MKRPKTKPFYHGVITYLPGKTGRQPDDPVCSLMNRTDLGSLVSQELDQLGFRFCTNILNSTGCARLGDSLLMEKPIQEAAEETKLLYERARGGEIDLVVADAFTRDNTEYLPYMNAFYIRR